MHWFKLMLLMLPAFGGTGDETVTLNVTDGVNQTISMAADVAQSYEPALEIEPAWETVIREELADSPKYADELVGAIASASEETGIEPAMLWSVAWTESHGRHWKDGGKVKRGGAGEVGLMQIKPFWSKALKNKHGIEVDLYKLSDNVRAGAHILTRGGDSPSVMLSYYNTGQKLKSTPYQRKVMKYWNSIDEVPAKVDLKTLVTTTTPTAAKPVVSSKKSKPAVKGSSKQKQQDKAEQKEKKEQKNAPPSRSFRPE